MEDLKSGDVVNLKGNSTKMTVETVRDDKVQVVWFDPDACLHRATLETEAVEKTKSRAEKEKLLQESMS